MKEGVLLLMYATVLQIGGERYALSISLFVVVPILAKQTLLICWLSDDFCKNGGNCSYPNTQCNCTEDWMGSRCDIGKKLNTKFKCLNWLNLMLAICEDDFCLNGGECYLPNIECICPPDS